MALTKAKKQEVIDEVAKLLEDSKLTVVAQYDGTTVKQMQELRRQAKDSATKVKVIKNRLVKKALTHSEKYKDIDANQLTKQLLYAFNSEDEVAPAKSLADFAKKAPSIRFVGGITAEGVFIDAEEIKQLASLPSKPELIAGVIATLNSPLDGVMNGLGGGLSSILSGLEAHTQNA